MTDKTYFDKVYKEACEITAYLCKMYNIDPKGTVTVNGVSLTVCNPTSDSFQVCIIPYTHDNTNFCAIQKGSMVNLEFDIIGKYISRMNQLL